MSKNKIVFLCSSLSNGGAERVVSILSQKLSSSYDILLFLLDGEDVTYDYKGQIVDLQFKHVVAKIKKLVPVKHLTTIIALCWLLVKVRKLKKQFKPFCSISFLETPNILNVLSAVKEKVIVSVRSTRSIQNRSLYEKMENTFIFLYKKAHYIISISDGVKEDLVSKFSLPHDKIVTIYNPYNKDYINNLMEEELDSESKCFFENHDVISMVGRLIPQKKQERLLQCVAQLSAIYPRIACAIIGSGERYDYLKELTREYKIEDRVFFVPFTKNPFKYMYNSKLYLSTSEREGFCNTIIEAMICRLPVVAVDCKCGPREIISNIGSYCKDSTKAKYYKRGVLVPLKQYDIDNSILNEAVVKTLYDLNTRKYVMEEVDAYINNLQTDVIAEKWKEIINN